MPSDSTATKTRILDAALHEFAQYGLAGARVDRIAETASANKRSIYVYFGNKAELFDLVVAKILEEMASAVPFTAADLPGYSVRLFDYLRAHPQVLRLTTWANLERPQPTPAEVEAYHPKVDAIAKAQHEGLIAAAVHPVDLLAFTISNATAWANASPALRSLADEPSEARLDTHRTAIADVERAITAAQ